MPKRLSDLQRVELKKWLESQNINNQPCNFNKLQREYSDAVNVAHILKRIYPKLIDLHNYPTRCNTQLKLDNWETLNQKVLSRIGLQQTKPTLEKLAKGVPGAIESLLYDILYLERRIESHKEERAEAEKEQVWSENEEIMMVNVSKKVGDAIVQIPQKMILYEIYEKALRDSGSKDAYLNVANQKISHLENILKLKGERIDELCTQLAKLSSSEFGDLAQAAETCKHQIIDDL